MGQGRRTTVLLFAAENPIFAFCWTSFFSMKHLFVLLLLLLAGTGAYAQTEKQVPVTKLPGEENLSLRERAERDFLMPVRRKKAVVEAPKAPVEENTAAPESDASARYSEAVDEAGAAAPAHTTRSYEARHTALMAARRAARREESRAEARHNRSARSSRSTKLKAHSKASARSSKAKIKSKASARAKASKSVKFSKASRNKALNSKRSERKSHASKSHASKSSARKSPRKNMPRKVAVIKRRRR